MGGFRAVGVFGGPMAAGLGSSWSGGIDIVLALVCAFVRFDGGRVVILCRPDCQRTETVITIEIISR